MVPDPDPVPEIVVVVVVADPPLRIAREVGNETKVAARLRSPRRSRPLFLQVLVRLSEPAKNLAVGAATKANES